MGTTEPSGAGLVPPGTGVALLEEMRGEVIRDLRELKVLSTGEVHAVVKADEDVPAAAPPAGPSCALAPPAEGLSAGLSTEGRGMMLEPLVLGGRDAPGRLDVRFLSVGILGPSSIVVVAYIARSPGSPCTPGCSSAVCSKWMLLKFVKRLQRHD